MSIYLDALEIALDDFIELELENLGTFPEAVIQKVRQDLLEELEENELEPSYIAIGIMFYQGLDWADRVAQENIILNPPSMTIEEAMQHYPALGRRALPVNAKGYTEVLWDMDTGNLILPVNDEGVAEYMARLATRKVD